MLMLAIRPRPPAPAFHLSQPDNDNPDLKPLVIPKNFGMDRRATVYRWPATALPGKVAHLTMKVSQQPRKINAPSEAGQKDTERIGAAKIRRSPVSSVVHSGNSSKATEGTQIPICPARRA
jgi:hypothetical protein